ncbi:uncharacterized protein BYT42DRAFT_585861 [Radiomyces spectabilis]|uniref:uncharacterized protein n=1 Tax=Radiomyces spectabilis TaxID=64574 RepID=UPI00221E5A41|nr:uncharacterized protein BYT42DRAFT_585861 [Radiomyces spectabilis]KAI8368237.1 hypothetical protein BYT42DRAFT_585861 [Radiomyces spectabilis]
MSSTMSHTPIPTVDELRNNIEFVAIAQFFHTFQSAFQPWPAANDFQRQLTRLSSRSGRGSEQPEEVHAFATEDLEHMLLKPEERHRLEELIVRMLRLLTRNRFINDSTWQMYFARAFDKRVDSEDNPFRTDQLEHDDKMESTQQDTKDEEEEANHELSNSRSANEQLNNFFTLPLDVRVHLLHLLCEWQLEDPERFREHLASEFDAIQWRVDPIGYDAKGNSFWLFDDNRLYKESPAPPKKKKSKASRKPKPKVVPTRRSTRRSAHTETPAVEEEEEEDEDEEDWKPWKLVCLTREDWEKLPNKFVKSAHPDEKQFYQVLVNDVLPKVIPVLEEHEKELKKQEALAHRKRSSRLMIRELEALERSQQIQQAELAAAGTKRVSSRREEMARKREEQQKEMAAKAREERLLERERRVLERARAAEEKEKRLEKQAVAEAAAAEAAEERKKQKQLQPPSGDRPPVPTKGKRGRKPKAAKKGREDEENWTFNCVCGVSGQNIDDGSPMIACERCGVWQHINCLRKAGAIDPHLKSLDKCIFVCSQCKKRKESQEDQEVDIDGMDDTPREGYAAKYVKRDFDNRMRMPFGAPPPAVNPPSTMPSIMSYPAHVVNGYSQAARLPSLQPWYPPVSQPNFAPPPSQPNKMMPPYYAPYPPAARSPNGLPTATHASMLPPIVRPPSTSPTPPYPMHHSYGPMSTPPQNLPPQNLPPQYRLPPMNGYPYPPQGPRRDQPPTRPLNE